MSALFFSRSSVNSRTFSIAITAWSAKVLQESDLLVGERLAPPPAASRWPRSATPSLQQRDAQDRSAARLRGLRLGRRDPRAIVAGRERLARSRSRDRGGSGPGSHRRTSSEPDTLGSYVVNRARWMEHFVRRTRIDIGVARLHRVEPRSRRSASKTGWTSVGRAPITRRISAVAVCCSSASSSSR